MDAFRVWCESCDWEDEVEGQNASSAAMLGHGLRTGHSETYREPLDDSGDA